MFNTFNTGFWMVCLVMTIATYQTALVKLSFQLLLIVLLRRLETLSSLLTSSM